MSRILVGDDHEEMRRLIVEVLNRQGYDVREAADTQGVLDGVASALPDLIILDVHMPGGGGLEALRSIREDPSTNGTPVLLLSGSMEALDENWAVTVGANASLPKPFPIDDLRDKVATLLAGATA